MSELVTIAKAGEPNLEILAEHLDEHIRLGWKEVEPEAKAPAKKPAKAAQQAAEE